METISVVGIGQRVKKMCGVCYPEEYGVVIDCKERPESVYCRAGIDAIICWENGFVEPVDISSIRLKDSKDKYESPIGIYID